MNHPNTIPAKAEAGLRKNECKICHQPKPINEYCTNDCQYLANASLEHSITTILGRWHGNQMKATEACYSIMSLFEATMLEIMQSARDEILMSTNLENRSEDFKHNFKVGMDEVVSKMTAHLNEVLNRGEKS